jgi:hypothetical protein
MSVNLRFAVVHVSAPCVFLLRAGVLIREDKISRF